MGLERLLLACFSRMVGRGRSPTSESSTPSLMPSNTVVVGGRVCRKSSSGSSEGFKGLSVIDLGIFRSFQGSAPLC